MNVIEIRSAQILLEREGREYCQEERRVREMLESCWNYIHEMHQICRPCGNLKMCKRRKMSDVLSVIEKDGCASILK